MKRRWLNGRAIIAILLVGFGVVLGKAFFDIHRKAATRRLEAELRSVILPRLELHDATVAEALAYLQTEGQKAGLRHGIRFTALSKQDSQKFFRKRVQLSGAESATIPGLPPNSEDAYSNPASRPDAPESPQKITVELTNIPLNEACMYVAGILNRRLCFIHDAVLFPSILEDGTFEPFYVERFRLHSDLFANAPKLPNGNLDARFPLETHGVTFYEGTSAEYDPTSDILTVLNTQYELDRVETLDSEGRRIPTMSERLRYWIESQLPASFTAPAPALPSLGLPPDPSPLDPQGPADGEPTSPSPAIPGL
ncbi:MAG: hypothetical protein ABIZ56_00830 [Chthoniobacteraceae bacterium]